MKYDWRVTISKVTNIVKSTLKEVNNNLPRLRIRRVKHCRLKSKTFIRQSNYDRITQNSHKNVKIHKNVKKPPNPSRDTEEWIVTEIIPKIPADIKVSWNWNKIKF